jgi:SAM-dependent methyltransferase
MILGVASSANHPGPGLSYFSSGHYQEHNRARLSHLDSLGLPLCNRSVLELGSGPGDHTAFYVDRHCSIVSVDARQDCLDVLARRFPAVQTQVCDLNAPDPLLTLGTFQVVHCYGILYHLEDPARLVDYLGKACSGFAVVETCVNPGGNQDVEIVDEIREDYTQSSTGRGCRPTREWVFGELCRFFPFVYHTKTQPAHPEFPLDWNNLSGTPGLIRSVFVASKLPLEVDTLSPVLLYRQGRLGACP